MRSAFVFDPAAVSGISGKYDLVHVSCLPFLCGIPFSEVERLRRVFSGNFPENEAPLSGGGPKFLLALPFISRGRAFRLFAERFPEALRTFDGFTLENIGDYEFLMSLFAENKVNPANEYFLAGDTAFNVFNSETAEFWRGKLDSLAILPELDPEEQKALAERFPEGIVPEIVSCGTVPVMRSEHCFAVRGKNFRCGACGKYGLGGGCLRDVKGREFRVVTNPLDCNCVLLGNVNPREPEAYACGIFRTDVFA
ncbi:MAG: hypothetical protein J6T65_07815 [Clostridia bacterium]|nr:hypothetical protein [Clostridia bacterium]